METKYSRVVSHQQRALAVIRIYMGLWFLWAVSAKLNAKWVGAFAKELTGYAQTTPVGFYAEFLNQAAIPAAQAFAATVILGELAVGLGLVLGLFTAPVALLGAFLNLNYLLATAGAGAHAVGLNLTFIVVLVGLAFAYAGTTWGIDKNLVGRLPWWFQGLLHYEYREF